MSRCPGSDRLKILLLCDRAPGLYCIPTGGGSAVDRRRSWYPGSGQVTSLHCMGQRCGSTVFPGIMSGACDCGTNGWWQTHPRTVHMGTSTFRLHQLLHSHEEGAERRALRKKNVVDMGSVLRRDVKAGSEMALDPVPGGFGFICAWPLSCPAVS